MKAKKYWTASVDVVITKRGTRTHENVAEAQAEYSSSPVLNNRDAADAARVLLGNLAIEGVVAIMLDGAGRVTGAARLALGVADKCVVWTRQVFTAALMCNAVGVIFAHNHPGGSVNPSEADWMIVEKMRAAGAALDIPLHDSLIITDAATVSMRSGSRWV